MDSAEPKCVKHIDPFSPPKDGVNMFHIWHVAYTRPPTPARLFFFIRGRASPDLLRVCAGMAQGMIQPRATTLWVTNRNIN